MKLFSLLMMCLFCFDLYSETNLEIEKRERKKYLNEYHKQTIKKIRDSKINVDDIMTAIKVTPDAYISNMEQIDLYGNLLKDFFYIDNPSESDYQLLGQLVNKDRIIAIRMYYFKTLQYLIKNDKKAYDELDKYQGVTIFTDMHSTLNRAMRTDPQIGEKFNDPKYLFSQFGVPLPSKSILEASEQARKREEEKKKWQEESEKTIGREKMEKLKSIVEDANYLDADNADVLQKVETIKNYVKLFCFRPRKID